MYASTNEGKMDVSVAYFSFLLMFCTSSLFRTYYTKLSTSHNFVCLFIDLKVADVQPDLLLEETEVSRLFGWNHKIKYLQP